MPDPTSTPHHPLRPPVPPVSPPSGTDRPSALLLPDAAPAPAPPSGSHAAPPPCSCRTDDLMRRLVEGIDASLADAPPGEAVLLALTGPPPTAGPPEHVDPTGGGRPAGHRLPPGHDRLPGDVGWMPLGDAHPLEAVLGMVVPPEWHALGLVCCGQALAEPTDPAGDLPVRVTTLLTRGGKATTVLREPGGARHITEVPGGALGDALRRALELPTAPPPASSAGLWVAWWLDRIVEAAMASPPSARWPVPGRLPGSPAGWAAVAGRHPACPFAPPGRGPRPATLAAATRDLARRWPWCRLRTDPRMRVTFVVGGADGDVATLPDLPPQDIADWMDDGMYARWLLGSFPAVADLLDACDQLLPDALADRVRTTVALTLPDEATTATAATTAVTAVTAAAATVPAPAADDPRDAAPEVDAGPQADLS